MQSVAEFLSKTARGVKEKKRSLFHYSFGEIMKSVLSVEIDQPPPKTSRKQIGVTVPLSLTGTC